MAAAHAVARCGQRRAGGPLARAPLADLAGAVPPRGELGRDRVAPVAAHPAAGQRGLEHRVARIGRRERLDVAGRHRGAQRVEGAAHGSTSALIASPLRASSSARPVSSQPDAVRDEGQRLDLPAGDERQRRAHVAGAGRVGGADVDLADVEVVAVEAERVARVRRRVEAQRAAGSDGGEAGRDGGGLRGADDDDVDELVAVALGAEGERALQALGARLARPHRLDGARVGGGDGQQAAGPAADDEQAVAGAQAAAIEGAQHAGQRLDEGRALGVEAVEDEQLADEVGRHAHALGEAAGVKGRGLEALAQRLVPAPAAPALAARRVVVHDDAIAHRDGVDLGADRGDLGRQLVAEHRRHLARDPASSTSEPHTPHASTRQTTSPGPGSGSGASSTRTSRVVSERATLMPAARRWTRRRAAARRPAR